MRKIKLNIFAKTLIISTIMLFIITMIAYMLIYALLPHFYKDYKLSQTEEIAKHLIDDLSKTNSEDQEKALLTKFVQNTSSTIVVVNENGEIFFQLSLMNSILLSQSNTNHEEVVDKHSFVEEDEVEIIKDVNEDKLSNLEYTYHTNSAVKRIYIQLTLQPLNEAKEVIISIYPFAGILSVGFSFILALLFSHSFAKPVRYIRKQTNKMINLESDAYIRIKSKDEIGELSVDINNLYTELRGTIIHLEKELQIFADTENQKIDFLRTLSHELKTPLASANALIEGIIYDVPPYCDNKVKYLVECKDFLDKAILLTKESLNLSPGYNEEEIECNLKSIIQDLYESYRVILKSKQIQYIENISDDILVNTKVKLITIALSNIFSNAVNYTKVGGTLKIVYFEESKTMIIENSCTPLSQEELNKIFLPFYSGNNKNELGNGLGLYIINQIFHVLKIDYKFETNSDGTGMQFIICI